MTWEPGTPVRLETERFVIRSLAPADVSERMVGWFGDPEVMEFVDLPRNVTHPQLLRFVGGFDDRQRFCLGIFAKDAEQIIGFFHVYCDRPNGNARVAVLIGERDFWGKNVVVETRAAILDFLFDGLSLHRVWGAIFSRNFPAVFNYKAHGFRLEGVLRDQVRGHDGAWRDVCWFGLLADDWRARREGGGP